MVTDDERREVERRLREEADYPGHAVQYMEQFIGDLRQVLFGDLNPTADYSEMFARLADLINPGDMLYVTYSRSTCGPDGMAYMVKVRHRARGLERDFYAVDLKKLLEVLDEMEITVKCAGPDVYRGYVEDWANEVREALGVCRED